jgi:hypothetical protein
MLLWLTLPLPGLTPVPAAAQPPGLELHGVVFSIEDGQADRKFLSNILVTVAEFGASATTNDQGGFRVRLPAGVLPGQDVTLQEDQKDYYILLPVLSVICRAIWRGPAPLSGRLPAALFGSGPRLIHR